jgi:hypothetical protein
MYLRVAYRMTFGKRPNFLHPISYTEKVQLLKLQYADGKYSYLADKYAVREFVRDAIGEQVLIPLYRHGDRPEDIPFNDLPNTCVIKCNHGSKYNIFVENKATLDNLATQKKLAQRLAEDFWKIGREMQYKHIKRKILIEALLRDEQTGAPYDYKFLCFHGEPRFIQVNSDRFGHHKVNFFDTQRVEQPFGIMNLKALHPLPKPTQLETMLTYAKKLSAGFPLMRVDFYEVNGKVYFGEITLTPNSGFEAFTPDHERIDRLFGSYFTLPART